MFPRNFHLKLLLLFCVQPLCEAFKPEIFLTERTKPVSDNLIDAINGIIENVYLKQFTTVNIITAVENPRDFFFLNFIDALMKKNKGFCIYRLDNYTNIQSIIYRLKIYNIILIDSYESFQILVKNITPENFNFRGFYLLVFVNGFISQIDNIFGAMWKKSIMNVNAIYEGKHSVNLDTFLPFTQTTCGGSNQIGWDTFNADTKSFNKPWEEIFPDKLINMFNCEVRLVTFDRCPASCVEDKNGELTVTGFDIGIIETIEERMNFNLKKTILPGAEQWGTVFANGSTTGAIKMILNNESDIAIGNFLLRSSRTNLMDPSMVYFSLAVVFAIPQGERLTPLKTLLRPFEFVVWIMLSITLAVGLLVIVTLNYKLKTLRAFVYGTGIKTPVINMMVAVFGGAQTKLPRRNFARFILMLFLMFCLIQRNAYQGSLYLFLKSDGRQKEVQSITEMVDKGFDFYMFESYVDIIQTQPRIYDK